MFTTPWKGWIKDNWDALVTGKKLELTAFLPHPAQSGFAEEDLAEEAGQCRDWILALTDESRLHVHEFADGRMVVHRDRWDPNRGASNMVKHVAFETTLGGLALVGLLGLGFYHLAKRA